MICKLGIENQRPNPKVIIFIVIRSKGFLKKLEIIQNYSNYQLKN